FRQLWALRAKTNLQPCQSRGTSPPLKRSPGCAPARFWARQRMISPPCSELPRRSFASITAKSLKPRACGRTRRSRRIFSVKRQKGEGEGDCCGEGLEGAGRSGATSVEFIRRRAGTDFPGCVRKADRRFKAGRACGDQRRTARQI